MNALSFKAWGRILWREAADQYAFCIGMFAMLLAAQASLATMDAFDMIPNPTVTFHLCMALGMTAIYAAASSALALTAEVDGGTFTFQRTRPVGWLNWLWGKMGWVVASSLLLGLAAWLETCIWQGVFSNGRDTAFALRVSGVGIFEGLAWGLIAGMLVRGPLRAVVAGVALGSLSAWLTSQLHHLAVGGGTAFVSVVYGDAAGPRLVVAAVALAIGLPLARIWYRTGGPLRWRRSARSVAAESQMLAGGADWDRLAEPSRGRVRRLVWHAWRQVRTAAIVYWALCLLALAGVAYLYCGKVKDFWHPDDDLLGSCLLLMGLAIIALSSLLTGYTFGPDQKGSFLQLARDGVSPREIWLSRMGVMAVILLPPALVLLVSLWQLATSSDHLFLRPLVVLVVVLGYCSILTIGQAASMFVRSRIVALPMTPVLTLCFAFWVVFGVFLLGLGWQAGAVPLLVALLIGSRLLVGTRLRQDHSWRAMRIPVLLVVVAVIVTYQAFAYHRVNEIRPYDSVSQIDRVVVLPWQLKQYTEKNDRESTPREWMNAFLTVRDDSIAASASSIFGRLWRGNSECPNSRTRFGAAYGYSRMLLDEARLSVVLREVARRPGIPNERLRAVAEFLRTWGELRPGCAEWLAVDCQRDMIWLEEGPRESTDHLGKYYNKDGFHSSPLPWQYRWFPFERKRVVRLLDRAYRIGADRVTEYEMAVIHDEAQEPLRVYYSPNLPPHGSRFLSCYDLVPVDPSRPLWHQAALVPESMTDLERHFKLLSSLQHLGTFLKDGLYTAEAQRRGTILFLALRMYVNDHGHLPDSLDALVEEKYLGSLPVIPISRRSFYYTPTQASDELNKAIQKANPKGESLAGPFGVGVSFLGEHDPSKPFLWYPAIPAARMDPRAEWGVFIDLDFDE